MSLKAIEEAKELKEEEGKDGSLQIRMYGHAVGDTWTSITATELNIGKLKEIHL